MLNQEEYFSDSVRHAEGGTVVLVRSTDRRQARSSPTQRKCFVCNYCLAGARHGHPFDSPDTEISPSNYIPYNRTIYGKPTDAPSVVLFGKHLFAASSLVLIFSKKIGFSLGEIKKMADIVQHSH